MTSLNVQYEQTVCSLDNLSNPKTEPTSSACGLPQGFTRLESQVAGHPFGDGNNKIAMFRGPRGRVLKPIIKPKIGEREISFYEHLQATQDPTTLELKNYVPKYYGTTELEVFGKRIKFLMLKDITEDMAEPCVMDIKIGRRTWDPLATTEKKAVEESKYAESKRAYGFCIPGFQVYNLSTGERIKFGKEYGKKLNAKSIVNVLENFLNITPEEEPCSELIVKLLSHLWRILIFFRTQKKFRFYSSSILVAYDARRLRQCLRLDQDSSRTWRPRSFSSPATCTDSAKTLNNIATRISSNPVSPTVIRRNMKRALKNFHVKSCKSLSPSTASCQEPKDSAKVGTCSSNPDDDKLCSQSLVQNSDEEAVRVTEDSDVLSNDNNLVDENHSWLRVNMIDFTHVFPAEDCTVDHNYLEGITNLINIIESFLIRKTTNT